MQSVDRCFFVCLRMKRTEESVKLLAMKDPMQRIVANLDASGISKDLFVQFVGDGYM